MAKPPIFLLCSERSGSNLIRVMLDAHSEISGPPSTHFLRDFIGRSDVLGNIRNDLNLQEQMRKSMKRSLEKHFPDQTDLIVSQLMDALIDSPASLVRTYYDWLSSVDRKPHLLVKENEPFEATAQIFSVFPDAKFVFQVRDPRDYVASGIALRSQWLGNKFGSLSNALRQWEKMQTFGLQLLGFFGPSRVHFLRYEDLVQNPKPVLAALCDFIGVEFEPGMLSFHEKEKVQKLAQTQAALGNLSKPLIAANFGAYRKTLSRRQIKAIEARLDTTMAQFGYARDFKGAAARSRFAIAWPSVLEPFERWANKTWHPNYRVVNEGHHRALEARAPSPRLSFSPYTAAGLEQGNDLTPVVSRLVQSAKQHWDCEALSVDGEIWLYSELFSAANQLAKLIKEKVNDSTLSGSPPRVAFLVDRSAGDYVAVIAILLAGGCYVPLNAKFPPERNKNCLERSEADLLLVTPSQTASIDALNAGPIKQLIFEPDRHSNDQIRTHEDLVEPTVLPVDDAYLLFTSGSTGKPKGILISNANLSAYLNAALEKISPSSSDRFSQTFDLTFDLSVHDMFVAWISGARLCVASNADLTAPAKYLQREKITHWFSVPSLGHIFRQQGSLNQENLVTLQSAIFCGEALSREIALDWVQAMPNKRVENWYGPTEATIACLEATITEEVLQSSETVPIGQAFPGMQVLILDEKKRPVEHGKLGRLFLTGLQVAKGYLNNSDLTAQRFVDIPGYAGKCYDTKDTAIQIGGQVYFRGRDDEQVKIRGYRIELGEIEQAALSSNPNEVAVALAWPHKAASATHTILVVETDKAEPDVDLSVFRERLPATAVPSMVFGLPVFPKNANGKIDRNEIAAIIQERIRSETPQVGDTASFEDRFMALVLAIKPGLTQEQVTSADNLLWAGFDSLNFVVLALRLEQDFDIDLDQDTVASLADMSYSELVNLLKRGQDAVEALKAIPTRQHGRVNRAHEFTRYFPQLVETSSMPLVISLGSSGLLRGLDVPAADEVFAKAGLELAAVNAGLPAISLASLVHMAKFVADTYRQAQKKPHAIFWELDPMMLSIYPPKANVNLDPAFFASKLPTQSSAVVPEFQWDLKLRGGVAFQDPEEEPAKRAQWEEKRDKEVAAAYAGVLPFVPERIEEWLSGAEILCELCANTYAFIHPVNMNAVAGASETGGLFKDLLTDLQQKSRATFISPDDFVFADSLFLNINHMRSGAGAQQLTRALMQRLI